jgi:cardiolipin synthase
MNAATPLPTSGSYNPSLRLFAEQAFSRAAGAPLLGGNAVDLLIDGQANFDAWLAAIRTAQHHILFENYIFADDELVRGMRDALAERAAAGVRVCVLRDWLGCLGQSGHGFWRPLLDAGGEVRVYNPPRIDRPFGWLARDHRKSLMVDGRIGFVGGVCASARWLGNAARGIAPWRDTGVAVRGPAVAELVTAFADLWRGLGAALPPDVAARATAQSEVGDVDLRVVATVPNVATLYRLEQLIAAMARRSLWLTDAYFVGVAPHVQALAAAARDQVDVRLLVPGSSDLPAVGTLSRIGYRPLLEAGVRVYEWNGSMLHAKTAVVDGRWARVGSSNLNLASWVGNCEIDLTIEDQGVAARMEAQYLADLDNATEIVLHAQRKVRRNRVRPRDGKLRGGSSGRAAAGALRLANTMSAAVSNRRVLGNSESGILLGGAAVLVLLAILCAVWPRIIAWPLALIAGWIGAGLFARYLAIRRQPPPSS